MTDRILIADDHPQTVAACRAALAQSGREALAAADLPAAAAILQGRLALVAVDAALPGGSVHSFCLRARNDGARVLLLAPPRFPNDALDALRPVVDAILFKPFDIEEFKQRVSALTSQEPMARGERAGAEPGASSAGAGRVAEAAADAPPDLAGTRIAGCLLQRFLGRGASGSVWLARHELLELQVAVKLLPADLLQWGPQDRQRFIRGARAAVQIQHPNVVQLLNAGEEQGRLFLVQRYVEGENLRTRVERMGRLQEREALGILSQIAAGLGAVHRLGLVHRDVKPANIMLDAAGRAMLTDFGLARGVGAHDISSVSAFVGTPLYISPEQCAGRPADGRSDLYSLGASIYHALTGRPPIQGDTLLAVLQGVERTRPPAPYELVPGISPAASALVMRLLEKEPAQRFSSAEELVRALDLIGPGVAVIPPIPARRRPASESGRG